MGPKVNVTVRTQIGWRRGFAEEFRNMEDYREFDHLFEKFGKEWVDKGDRRKACLEIVARLENLKMEEREGMEAMRS